MIEFLSGFLSGLGITSIIVALLENKYHIINRIRKRISIIKNNGTEANLSLEYKINKDFDDIFEKFKIWNRRDSGNKEDFCDDFNFFDKTMVEKSIDIQLNSNILILIIS